MAAHGAPPAGSAAPDTVAVQPHRTAAAVDQQTPAACVAPIGCARRENSTPRLLGSLLEHAALPADPDTHRAPACADGYSAPHTEKAAFRSSERSSDH